MDLKGKNVIYLGGFGGIGAKCIEEFLAKGIRQLAIFDVAENQLLLQTWQLTYGQQTNIIFVEMNIIDKAQVMAAYKTAFEQMGHFDVIVNGCGILNDQEIELTVQVNLIGNIYSTLIALSYMDKSKGGHGGLIINVASVLGLSPNLMFAIYSATKTATTTFMRSLAHPIVSSRTGVKFINICPAFTKTSLFDNFHGKLTFLDDSMQPLCEKFQLVEMQKSEDLARNFINAVESGSNGSTWLIEMGEMKEIAMPTLWAPIINKNK